LDEDIEQKIRKLMISKRMIIGIWNSETFIHHLA